MPYRIGGYYISFPTVYKVMEVLEIPNSLDYGDTLLEFATNFWLCAQNKLNVLTAYIHTDDQPGMMLVSSFKYIPYGIPDSGDLQASDRDRAIGRDWLMNDTGVKADELKWITLLDSRKITDKGIQPKRMTIGKSTKTPAEVIEEMKSEGSCAG